MSKYHSFYVHGSKFTVDVNYKPIAVIGQGAFGVVVSAKNINDGTCVAIKKVSSVTDDLGAALAVLREIKILRLLHNHPNILKIIDLIPPPPKHKLVDLYICTPLMESDLHHIIFSDNKLSENHVKYFTVQILQGLEFLRRARVIHRDLKPSNLLVNSNCDLIIADFGLARHFSPSESSEASSTTVSTLPRVSESSPDDADLTSNFADIRFNDRCTSKKNVMDIDVDSMHVDGSSMNAELSEYVVTRNYRAPEIMISGEYDYAVDMWSVGCILAEMIERRPLFVADDHVSHMTRVFDVVGTPTTSDEFKLATNPDALKFLKSLTPVRRCTFAVKFPNGKALQLDLLQRMLIFHPARRISVKDALAHPWFEQQRYSNRNGTHSQDKGLPDVKTLYRPNENVSMSVPTLQHSLASLSPARLSEVRNRFRRGLWSEIDHFRHGASNSFHRRSASSTIAKSASSSE